MTATSNPFNSFASAIETAAVDGYIGTPRPVRAKVLPVERSITERQHDFAVDLLDSRDVSAETRPAWRNRLVILRDDMYATGGELWMLTADQASALIDCLLALPVRERAPQSAAQIMTITVGAGRYAVDNEQGSTSFYRVDVPTEGKWAGCTFVKLMVGDDEIRMGRNQAAAIIKKIESAGVRESAIRYGHEIGDCAICGRTLTNESSRRAGIGPVCAGKNGW